MCFWSASYLMQVDGVETHFGRGEFRVQCIAPDVRYTASHTEKKVFL